jgi:hypothetical protein
MNPTGMQPSWMEPGARRHKNPDGSMGGWVAPGVYVSPDIKVPFHCFVTGNPSTPAFRVAHYEVDVIEYNEYKRTLRAHSYDQALKLVVFNGKECEVYAVATDGTRRAAEKVLR